MIGQFDFSEKGWVSGKGRSAVWREISPEHKQVEPQYLMGKEHHEASPPTAKVAIMDVTSSTNTRTMIVTPLAGTPCGHSIGVLNCPPEHCVLLSAALNSIAFDFALRVRFSGLHTSWFIIEETPLLKTSIGTHEQLSKLAASLGLGHPSLAWVDFDVPGESPGILSIAPHERMRLSIILDVLVASGFGLNLSDLQWVLRQCDLPRSKITEAELTSKGFWRVDKDKDPELRRTNLTLIAFNDLESKTRAAGGNRTNGSDAFLHQNGGEGWMLPETLRLADYDLGHDERAHRPQPVASRLGPRFFDWQLAQGSEVWRDERRLHAMNLLEGHEYERLARSTGSDHVPSPHAHVESQMADKRGHGPRPRPDVAATLSHADSRNEVPRRRKDEQVDLFE